MQVQTTAPARSPSILDILRNVWLYGLAWSAIAALSLLKYFCLSADFPNNSPWMIDQAKFTDEGWWANAAIMHQLLGHWRVAGDYNPAVVLPVWPSLLSILFHFTGVSIIAARALNVTLSIATLVIVFCIVRRYTAGHSAFPATLTILVLAASPFAFFFSRLATLDTLVIFEFFLALLVASKASMQRIWSLIALSLLISAMILTKTTAIVLIPAVFWIAWQAIDGKRTGFVRAIFSVGIFPAVLVKLYAAAVSLAGYGDDYRYFFAVNAVPPIELNHTYATITEFLRGCLWIDRSLCYLVPVILVFSIVWKRSLWCNPLSTACWIALAGQTLFLFSRQEDFAPRYYLPMLPPLAIIVGIAYTEVVFHSRKIAFTFAALLVFSAAFNTKMILQFLSQRQYQFINAANSIKRIVQSNPQQKQLMLGISGSQISLMTGIPSINDSYGTEDMNEKVLRYQPGWYLAWNTSEEQEKTFLAPFRVEKIASYPAFDDDDRNELILYKLALRNENISHH